MKPSHLVFLHGGPGHQDYLGDYFAGKFDKQIRTTFYPQEPSAGMNVERLVQELGALAGSGAGEIVLVGHSWGGVLANEYLIRTGDTQIKGIVLSILTSARTT